MRMGRIAGALALLGAAAAAETNENGLHVQPWFAVTSENAAEDMAGAAEPGKRPALIVAPAGCIYCAKLHEEVLIDPEAAAYVTEHVMVVQIAMFSDEAVVDPDGEAMTERQVVRRWRMSVTPAVVFPPETAPAAGAVVDAAVKVTPGAFGTWTTLNMVRRVAERRYAGRAAFQEMARGRNRGAALRAAALDGGGPRRAVAGDAFVDLHVLM